MSATLSPSSIQQSLTALINSTAAGFRRAAALDYLISVFGTGWHLIATFNSTTLFDLTFNTPLERTGTDIIVNLSLASTINTLVGGSISTVGTIKIVSSDGTKYISIPAGNLAASTDLHLSADVGSTKGLSGTFIITLDPAVDGDSGSGGSSVEFPGTARTAASGSYADITSAIAACSDGDTLTIPSGTTNIAIPNVITVNKRIWIKGSGTLGTIINRTGTTTAYTQWLFNVTVSGVAISNLKLVGNYGNGHTYVDEINQSWGIGAYNAGAKNLRIFNNDLSGFSYAAITVEGTDCSGTVIYGNNIHDVFDPIYNGTSWVGNLAYGVQVGGQGAWEDPLVLGDNKAVYVELNTFDMCRHCIASNNGSNYVFRYNTVYVRDKNKDYAQVDAHGYTGASHGSRSYEIYGNHFYVAEGLAWAAHGAIGIRGGDGVIYNNVTHNHVSGSWNKLVVLQVEGFACGVYPGTDQIRSLYIWGNSGDVTSIDNTCTSSIGLNRDYFLSAKSGYTAYTYPHPNRI